MNPVEISEPKRARGSRRGNNAPTLADVAREAKCSPMTVSRVINNEGNVREKTREEVRAAIARLNYSPNRAARALAGADQVRVALLYSNPSASYLSELLMGALEQASLSHVHLIVEQCEFASDEFDVVQRLADSGITGFILPSPLCDEQALLDHLSELGTCVIAVGAGEKPAQHSSVMIDEQRAAFDMTRHIIALGHRRIGFIIGNPQQSASAQRLAGYREAMEAADLAIDPDLVAQGQFTYRSGLAAAERLFARSELPTAVFASNDDMAAAVIAAAHRLHLDVPADVSVCGFDDTAIASTMWPELTTIRQPIRQMSRKAIELLALSLRARHLKKECEVTHVTLGYELVRRQSDAAPTLAVRSARKLG